MADPSMTVLMWPNCNTGQNDSTLDLSEIHIEEADIHADLLPNIALLNPSDGSNFHYLMPYDSRASSVVSPVKSDVSSDASDRSSQSSDLCHICGDKASGFHYNAFSCEGCKGFFRRSITRGATYVCKYGGHCEMDMWMRRKCQSCRLRRCKEVGMKEECLLSDDQCKARDARRKVKKFINSINRQFSSPYPVAGSRGPSSSSEQPSDDSSQSEDDMMSSLTCNPLEMLSEEEREMIEKLVTYQDKYEVPTQEAIDTLPSMKFAEGAGILDVSDTIFRRMASMTILVTHLVVEVAKRLPGFMELDSDNQIVLLKGSASEVMVLRTARRYDPSTDSVVFGDGVPFTRTSMRFGGMQDYVDDMFEFSRGMTQVGVDNAEYSLLTAICIFSDRPGLTDSSKVERIQEKYVTTLRNYLRYRRPDVPNALARLLMKLVDLRTLSCRHGQVLNSLKVEKGSLPPLLSEYFDLFD